jgi:hypothetical protein
LPSGDKVVVYGGEDSHRRPLGDVHVLDLQVRASYYYACEAAARICTMVCLKCRCCIIVVMVNEGYDLGGLHLLDLPVESMRGDFGTAT